jgi:hypothetical protein
MRRAAKRFALTALVVFAIVPSAAVGAELSPAPLAGLAASSSDVPYAATAPVEQVRLRARGLGPRKPSLIDFEGGGGGLEPDAQHNGAVAGPGVVLLVLAWGSLVALVVEGIVALVQTFRVCSSCAITGGSTGPSSALGIAAGFTAAGIPVFGLPGFVMLLVGLRTSPGNARVPSSECREAPEITKVKDAPRWLVERCGRRFQCTPTDKYSVTCSEEGAAPVPPADQPAPAE